jgi:hypothetical protein
MAAENVHVIPHPDGWAVTRENARASFVYKRQQEAINSAREFAQHDRVELLVHGGDGKVRFRDRYGNDPPRAEGGP